MNYVKLFYWLTVADNCKSFFVFFIVIFAIMAIVSLIVLIAAAIDDNVDLAKLSRKWLWYSIPFLMFFWALNIFTPDKKDSLLIVAGGQTLNFLTTDSTSKQIPHELSAFVVSELKNMALDAKVDLGLNSQKEKILEEAKIGRAHV